MFKPKRTSIIGIFAALSVLILGLAGGGSAAADHVDPVVTAGNPDCGALGYDFGFKPQPEPPPTGTYFFGGSDTKPAHTLTGDSVDIVSDGTFFDWTSTLGLDAVIVKGGADSNVYTYDPEQTADTGLHPPANSSSGGFFSISHIEFCYDFELTVEKDAETSFTRTFEWDIDKSVTPDEWDLFSGDTGTSKYAVSVTKTGFTDSAWTVNGAIWIANDAPFDATIEGVSDAISGFGAVAVDCGVGFPHVLAAGQSLHCTYTTPLPDGSDRINTAMVETSGIVGGGEAAADVVFGDPTNVVNATVNVSDTNGGAWQFDDTGMVMYERTFGCGGDAGTHDNTATIDETGQSDAASVTVRCYELGVEKNATTSFTRAWNWTIEKTATETDLVLAPGQVSPPVTYWVSVDATSADSAFAVAGEIWISNPNPATAAMLTSVADVVSPDIAAEVDCPGLVVPAGGSLHCTYDGDLPDGSDRTNTATATLQNNDHDKDGNASPSETTDFSGSADVGFDLAQPTSELDECIDVSDDSNVGFLGTVCAADAPASFHYDLTFGPFAEPADCGDHDFLNTASFVTNDSGASGDTAWNVHVFVACAPDGGCTLTQGYWKTHSKYGPAPFDEAWDWVVGLNPDGVPVMGADVEFLDSGLSYYEVLWTAPKGGNAWFILAHQYIAAELNHFHNGAAAPPEVVAALDAAQALLEHYQGNLDVPKRPRADRESAIELYSLLDDYNNGLVGPGHCDE